MELDKMSEVIDALRPGYMFRIVFRDETFDGDLKGRLYMILEMHGQSIDFGEMPMWNLKSVADSGEWHGFRTYIIRVLEGFDPEYFARRTLDREMLESIEHQHIVANPSLGADSERCLCGVYICGMFHPEVGTGCLRAEGHAAQGLSHFNYSVPELGEWEVGRSSVPQ